jgi:ABC-type sugar transport system substrate-binding protein
MKKYLSFLLILIIGVSLMLAGVSCKGEAAETTAAVGETTAAVGETTAAETSAVVAGEQEYYIIYSGGWKDAIVQEWAWGGWLAQQYWNSKGDNIKVEWMGPTAWNAEEFISGLEAAIAKKPTGILAFSPNLGEDKLLTDYYNSGGLLACLNGAKGNFPADFVVGTDGFAMGKIMAEQAVKGAGESFDYAVIGSLTNEAVASRGRGMAEYFAKYPGIKLIQTIEQPETKEECNQMAAAFLAANPDVKVFASGSSFGGAAWALACKEAGLQPGEKVVIATDKDEELLNYIDEGWVQYTISQNFPLETFYGITNLHLMKMHNINISTDDVKALGRQLPGPIIITTTMQAIGKGQTDYYRGMQPPEGFPGV